MFIHIIKDYKKKLDDIDQRLEKSLDKDEIQTLGIKLRFYQNELKHYLKLIAELQTRTADIQQKFGFETDASAFVPLNAFGLEEDFSGERTAPPKKETPEEPPYETEPREEIEFEEPAPPAETYDEIPDEPEWAAEEKPEWREPEPEPTPIVEPETLPDTWVRGLRVGDDPETICEAARDAAEKHHLALTLKLEEITDTGGAAGDPTGHAEFIYGTLAAALERHGTAINLLEAAMRKGVDYPAASRILADSLFRKGLYPRALRHYAIALRLEPHRSSLQLDAARCHLLAGEPEQADQMLTTFEDENLKADALALRAESRLAMKQPAAAFDMADDALSASGTPELRGRCLTLMARAREAGADDEAAMELYEKSVEENPANPEAIFSLGALYLRNRALPLAREQFVSLIKNFPESEWTDNARELLYKEGIPH